MRNTTIDIAKGIGILTVVLCHNWILYNDRGELSRLVFSFHMPLFFFISGVFFKPSQSFLALFKSKADGLLKPYFTTLISLTVVSVLFQHASLKQELIRILYGAGATLDWTPMWFLTHLFLVYLVAWVLYKSILLITKNRLWQQILLVLIYFIGVLNSQTFWEKDVEFYGVRQLVFGQQQNLLGLPFNADILLITVPIFLFGFIWAKQLNSHDFKLEHTLIVLAVFFLLHYFFNETIELNARQFGQPIICTLQIVLGIYSVFGISKLLSRYELVAKVFAYLGSASLFILIFHFSFQHRLTGILQYYFHDKLLLMASIGFVVSILFSLFVYEVVRKISFLSQLMLPTKSK